MATTRSAQNVDIAAWRGLVRVQGAVRRELDGALQAAEDFDGLAVDVVRV